jgi:hypothetical protein
MGQFVDLIVILAAEFRRLGVSRVRTLIHAGCARHYPRFIADRDAWAGDP